MRTNQVGRGLLEIFILPTTKYQHQNYYVYAGNSFIEC